MNELLKCPFCSKEFLTNRDLYNHVKSKEIDKIHTLDTFIEGTIELKEEKDRLSLLSIQRKSLDAFENEEEFQANFKQCFDILVKYEKELRITFLPELLMDKIWFHRKHHEYEIARSLAEQRLNYAIHLLEKNPHSSKFVGLKISSLKMLIECAGKELKQRINEPKILADFYADSAKKIENLDFKYYAGLLSEYYKYKALEKLKNRAQFKRNIELAIDWSKKANYSTEYLERLRFNRLYRYRLRNPQSYIDELEKKKIQFFMEGKNEMGNEVLFEIELLKAQYAEFQSDFSQARNHLMKAKKKLKTLKLVSLLTGKDYINNLLLVVNFKDAFSNQDYSNALSFLDNWFENNTDQLNTQTYHRNQLYYYCTKILEKDRKSISEVDIKDIEVLGKKNVKKVKFNKIFQYLKDYIHFCCSKAVNAQKIQDLIIKITNIVVGPQIASEMRRMAILETALTEMTWIESYPSYLQERYQRIFSFFSDLISSPEANEAALQQLYKLLEKILEIFIECQSKLVWGRKWKAQIKEKTNKDINRLTFGDYILIFHDIYEIKRKNDISIFMHTNDKNIEDSLRLLNKHVAIRNSIAHDFTQLTYKETNNYFNEVTQILFFIHTKFPVCGKIENVKGNKYQVKLEWSKNPKLSEVYVLSKDLKPKEDFYYYFFPREIFEVDSKHLPRPRIIISAYYLPKQLKEPIQQDNNIIFSSNKLKRITDIIFDQIQNSVEDDQLIKFIQSFMPTHSRREIVTTFLSVYGHSYNNLNLNEEDSFSFPAQTLLRCLTIIERLFGSQGRKLMMSFYNQNLRESFKNLIFGNTIGKTIFPPTKYIYLKREFLENLVSQFEKYFIGYGVKIPTVDDILISCIRNLRTNQNAVRVLSLLELTPENINLKMKLNPNLQDWSLKSHLFSRTKEGSRIVICKALFFYTVLRSNSEDLLNYLTSSLKFIKTVIEDYSLLINLEEQLLRWMFSVIKKILFDPDFECEWAFSNKQDVLEFIKICSKSFKTVGLSLDKEDIIFDSFLIESKNKNRNIYFKIDKLIQGPLTLMYKALLKKNLGPLNIYDFLLVDQNEPIDNIDNLWNVFIDLFKFILLENDYDKTLKYFKNLVNNINILSNRIDIEIDEEEFITRFANLICSIIQNDRGKWGIHFQIANEEHLDEFLILAKKFFSNLGITPPLKQKIKDEIFGKMAQDNIKFM